MLQAFKSTKDIVLLNDLQLQICNVTVESIANKYDADLIIARDAQWKRMNVPINSGVIFKRSQWTVDSDKYRVHLHLFASKSGLRIIERHRMVDTSFS